MIPCSTFNGCGSSYIAVFIVNFPKLFDAHFVRVNPIDHNFRHDAFNRKPENLNQEYQTETILNETANGKTDFGKQHPDHGVALALAFVFFLVTVRQGYHSFRSTAKTRTDQTSLRFRIKK